MIECTDKNIYYKRHRKGKFKRCFSIFLAFLIVFSIFFYYKRTVVRVVSGICGDYAYSYSTKAVNIAVLNTLQDGIKYTDLISIKENANGDIVLLTANSYKINLLSREIVEKTQSNLAEMLNSGIPIPLLSFFGFQILSGYGKIVQLKTCSVSGVNCQFFSEFTSVGINQTLHSIYINVTAEVKINLTLHKEVVALNTEVLISESVLVGKVPEIYFGSKLFS